MSRIHLDINTFFVYNCVKDQNLERNIQKMNERLYNHLAKAAQYYQIKEELSNRIQQEENTIRQIETDFNDELERKKKPYESINSLGTLLWIPSICILALTLIVVFFYWVQNKPQLSDLPLFLVALSVPTVSGIIMVVFSRSKKQTITQKYEQIHKNQIQPQIKQLQESLSNLHNTAIEFESENKHLIEVLPISYRNIEASSFLFLAIANGRADTLKEAVNLYEEWLHRQMLENAAKQTAEAQEYMALALDELNDRQAETNNHLKAIEFMQYWQYTNRKN